ncbi:indole-3-glycerol phosphate synthase TrpC [Faecalibacter macacae]|uniref:Indole-3-glycerol phosphate synthase n=1 Tax=Faecalibacter macacae TaxID=1859289 RepID=A0A3L9M714_9FLAO|nr:indole-3-glycerol phosphate synthase TrpC [Faecalibacter macacae]RLZ08333.1 indole-3-glycerol phosphate synthase TrpC [Faecalibacter macacae]
MKNILDQIVDQKRIEIKQKQQQTSIEDFKQSSFFTQKVRSAKASILDPNKTGIIAEFKRKSPSKGFINQHANIKDVVSGYEQFGASVVSVLTDEDFFGGSFDDLNEAKQILNIPILRKDFIVDEYQVYETKAIGADLMLLIAECLTKDEVFNLAKLAKEIGLEILLEIHSEDQLEKVNEFIDLIGINNRNLKTFEVDTEKSKQILKKLPEDLIKVAESGISDPEVVKDLKAAGFQSFLIGENFMKNENPGNAFQEFVNQIK